MPYIKQQQRALLEGDGIAMTTAGELNYKITLLLRDYMQTRGLCYTTINDILGALEGAKLEFYRRVAAPYEDKKVAENGDVY